MCDTVICVTDRYNLYSHENKSPGIVLINLPQLQIYITGSSFTRHSLSCYNGTVQLAECYTFNTNTITKFKSGCQPQRYKRFNISYSQGVNTLFIHITNTADKSYTMPGDVEFLFFDN